MACSDSLCKTDLFKKCPGPCGFRIPALLHIPDSNILLAFAESRHGSNDESADLLYLRRGEYNKSSKDFQWEDATPMNSAKLENCRSMNPCPVYEKEKKEVFLFFIAVAGTTSERVQIKTGKNAAHLCYVTSDNNGQTWGDTIHLTDKCNGPKAKPCTSDTNSTWATFVLGPGHGIQLNSGRLVIPAYAHVKEGICKTRVRAFTFYSDDGGKCREIGEFTSGKGCGECQVVSLDQDNAFSEQSLIYCNARNNKNQYRVEAFSTDGGKTFTEGKPVKQLVECPGGCHGSIISFPASDISHAQNYPELVTYHTQKGGDASNFHVMLFSHITNSKSRSDLGIYLCTYSGDPHTHSNPCCVGGLTWTNPWVFFPHKSAYSELAFVKLKLREETKPIITCLFESGDKNNEISLCVFQINDIIEKTVKKLNDSENPEAGKCAISRCFCCCCC